MCELLGLCFNKLVDIRFSFRRFRERGRDNPDGWGLAFYPEGGRAAAVFKEALTATESKLAGFLENYGSIRSKIFISHVRKATRKICYENTHPFVRELWGRDWVFAHNGDLSIHGESVREHEELGRFRPIGTTDSEWAFCYILGRIEERGVKRWDREDFRWLNDLLLYLNDYGRLNCLFSDGDHLFAYHDANGYKGLWYVERKAPFPDLKLIDPDHDAVIAGQKDPEQRGFVIATEPLTERRYWRRLDPGQLMVFKDGRRVYP